MSDIPQPLGQATSANSTPVVLASDQSLKTTTGVSSSDNVASESSITLLRRIVKLLESNAVVDQQNRQRIDLDVIAAGVTLPTVTSVTTVTTVSTVSNVATIANVDHHQFIDIARNTYANGIRSKLAFS